MSTAEWTAADEAALNELKTRRDRTIGKQRLALFNALSSAGVFSSSLSNDDEGITSALMASAAALRRALEPFDEALHPPQGASVVIFTGTRSLSHEKATELTVRLGLHEWRELSTFTSCPPYGVVSFTCVESLFQYHARAGKLRCYRLEELLP